MGGVPLFRPPVGLRVDFLHPVLVSLRVRRRVAVAPAIRPRKCEKEKKQGETERKCEIEKKQVGGLRARQNGNRGETGRKHSRDREVAGGSR